MGSLEDRSAAMGRNERAFDATFTQFAQTDSGMGGGLWQQTVLGQSRNRVDFENPGPALLIQPQIDSRQALGADRQRGTTSGIDQRRHRRAALGKLEAVFRRRVFVFCDEVEELPWRGNLNQRQRLVIKERQGPLRAGHGPLKKRERVVTETTLESRGERVNRANDAYPQARALRIRFYDERKSDAIGQFAAPLIAVRVVHQHIDGRRHAALEETLLRGRLAERQPRCFGSAAREDDAHAIEDALNRPILSVAAMQGEKGDVDVAK